MNLVNITDNDLININKIINGEGLTVDLLEELSNKLDYCVTQINIRNEYMDKVDKINKEYQDKLKKEDKENTENKEEVKDEVVRGEEFVETSDLEVTDEVIKEYGEMPTEIPLAPETHKETDAYEVSD